MIPFLHSSMVLRITWALLHFLWQGALLWVLAWALLRMLGRTQTRYFVACAFLLLACALPIATIRLQVFSPSARVVKEVEPAPIQGNAVVIATPIHTGSPLPAPPKAGLRLASWTHRIETLMPSLFAFWILGMGVLGLRTAGGWLWLQRIKARARPVEEEWMSRLQQLAVQCGLKRNIRFLMDEQVPSPFASGILRPIVMLPLGFFAAMDPLAVEAVITHELAHIRRFDALVNALQCLAETVLFFHPFVWWISRQIRNEREHCCDDDAVLACGDPVLFAETLNRLDAMHGRFLQAATAAAGGNLVERIQRLVSKGTRPRRSVVPGLVLILGVLFGATAIVASQATSSVVSATPDFQSITRDGYTMNLVKTPDFPQVTVDRLFECFFKTYPVMAARFNPDAPKNVTIVMEPFSPGVGRSFDSPSVRWLSAKWLQEKPDDVDILTYHVFSIIEAYPVEKHYPMWLTKGLGNYARGKYGVYNEQQGYHNEPYSKDLSYTTLINGISFGPAGSFFEWMEKKVDPAILEDLNRTLRSGTYTEDYWKQRTSKTLDQLWNDYAKDSSL